MQFLFHLVVIILLIPSIAFSGTIKGTTIFSGEAPSLSSFKTGKYKKACGPEIPNETLLIDKKRLKNVVISLNNKNLISKIGEYHLDKKNCRYEPHVMTMPVDTELKIHTSDPVNHNIHTYSFDNDPINIMFIPDQEEYSHEMEEAEIIKVACDLHSWMTAWIVVTPNSYATISKGNGTFEIGDVPSGNYKLTAWHETLGSLTKDITIKDDDVNIIFDFIEVKLEEVK